MKDTNSIFNKECNLFYRRVPGKNFRLTVWKQVSQSIEAKRFPTFWDKITYLKNSGIFWDKLSYLKNSGKLFGSIDWLTFFQTVGSCANWTWQTARDFYFILKFPAFHFNGCRLLFRKYICIFNFNVKWCFILFLDRLTTRSMAKMKIKGFYVFFQGYTKSKQISWYTK